MALSADRDTDELDSSFAMEHALEGEDSQQFYKGGLVAFDSADSKLKPGATSTTLTAVGRCEENVLTGASNTREIRARSGIFKFDNSGGSITAADIGNDCYIVDDETVHQTDGGSTRSVAGKVYKVDSDGVWVAIGFPL